MSSCSSCDGSLNDSIFIESRDLKSCPHCSALAGHHIFYRCEDFGMRDMGDGRYILQSWCPGCRSHDGIRPTVQAECQ